MPQLDLHLAITYEDTGTFAWTPEQLEAEIAGAVKEAILTGAKLEVCEVLEPMHLDAIAGAVMPPRTREEMDA